MAAAQRSKKYRDKIKEEVKYEQYLEREKERYKKRKESGQLKSISQLSKREQRYRRRQWKVNQRNKRDSDKNRASIQSYIAGSTPPESPIGQEHNEVPISEDSPEPSDSHETPHHIRGRRKVRANRAKAYRDLAESNLKLERAMRNVQRYKKRYQRLAEKLNASETPKKKLKHQMQLNPKALRRTLLFQNVVLSELRKKYRHSGTKEKQVLSMILALRILKKYGIVKEAQQQLGFSAKMIRKNCERL